MLPGSGLARMPRSQAMRSGNHWHGKVESIGQQVAKDDMSQTDPVSLSDARVVEVKVRLDNSNTASRLIHGTRSRLSSDLSPGNALMPTRVPLAWLQLTHEKLRLLAAVAGIAFAVVLMLVQLGLLDALFNASALVQSRLQGDLVIVSKQYNYLVFSKNFPKPRLYQALAADGVESVWPVYLGLAQWKKSGGLTMNGLCW